MLIKRCLLERLLRARTIFTGQQLRPVPHVLQTRSSVETTQGPLWLLTDECGQDLQRYPSLTSEEQRYLGCGPLSLVSYPTSLLSGYSAWWQGQKWYSPAMCYGYEPLSTGEGIGKHIVWAFVKSEAERLMRARAMVPGATVLLDLNPSSDCLVLCLLVPMQTVIDNCTPAAWFQFLTSLFEVPSALPLGTQVYLQCNKQDLIYSCRIFDMAEAPLSDEANVVTAWLHDQDPCRVEWGPSEQVALHNARLVCERLGYEPVDLFCEPVDLFE